MNLQALRSSDEVRLNQITGLVADANGRPASSTSGPRFLTVILILRVIFFTLNALIARSKYDAFGCLPAKFLKIYTRVKYSITAVSHHAKVWTSILAPVDMVVHGGTKNYGERMNSHLSGGTNSRLSLANRLSARICGHGNDNHCLAPAICTDSLF